MKVPKCTKGVYHILKAIQKRSKKKPMIEKCVKCGVEIVYK